MSVLLFHDVIQLEEQFEDNDNICHRQHRRVDQPTSSLPTQLHRWVPFLYEIAHKAMQLT